MAKGFSFDAVGELMIRVAAAHESRSAILAQPALGPQAVLQPMYDLRPFTVLTIPVVTVVGGFVVGVLVQLVCRQRRQEVLSGLYGFYGLAVTLWAQRVARTLAAVEAANRTLEACVQRRDRETAASYERIAVLQREYAATDERQRIMRDLYDGLVSPLLTSLLRAERGALEPTVMIDTLRSAIHQMRIAIEALGSEEKEFRTAFGNLRFHWDTRPRECGLTPVWRVDLPDTVLAIAPHDALQILQITQDALTNVLKHSRARTFTVVLQHASGALTLEVIDDGPGPAPDEAASPGSSGRSNMAVCAERPRGAVDVAFGA